MPLPAAVQKNLGRPALQPPAPNTATGEHRQVLPQRLPPNIPSSPQPARSTASSGQSASGAGRSRLHDRLGVTLRHHNRHVVVEELIAGGVLQKSGLQVGDALVSINGQTIENVNEFDKLVFGTTSHETLELKVQRNGREQTVQVNPADYLVVYSTTNRAALGVNLDRRYTDRAVLANVTPGGPADRIGLQIGDVILRVDELKVGSPKELIEAIGRFQPGDKVEIEVSRAGKTDSAVAELSAATRGPANAMNVAEPPSGSLEPANEPNPELAPNPFGADRVGQRNKIDQKDSGSPR